MAAEVGDERRAGAGNRASLLANHAVPVRDSFPLQHRSVLQHHWSIYGAVLHRRDSLPRGLLRPTRPAAVQAIAAHRMVAEESLSALPSVYIVA